MTDEEDVTAQLLRLAGAPPGPSVERVVRVRNVVHREWRAGRRRRIIRRASVIGLLGLAASLTIAVWINRQRTPAGSTDQVVAIGQRIQGRPVIRSSARTAAARPLTASTSIRRDELIETDAASRAAVQGSDGTSVRIDRSSRVRFITSTAIEVIAGAVYVETSNGSHGFEVRTAMGGVRDVGTQFEVRLAGSSLRLRVRTGAVEVRRGSAIATATAGTEAVVTSGGIESRPLPPYGPEWAWTSGVAPSFAIEGQPLHAFLVHTAAEEGWTLRYADTGVADTARRTILHGSVEGLNAEDALGAALATSGLQYRLSTGELLVSRPADAR